MLNYHTYRHDSISSIRLPIISAALIMKFNAFTICWATIYPPFRLLHVIGNRRSDTAAGSQLTAVRIIHNAHDIGDGPRFGTQA